jgi:hypothetical protein
MDHTNSHYFTRLNGFSWVHVLKFIKQDIFRDCYWYKIVFLVVFGLYS